MLSTIRERNILYKSAENRYKGGTTYINRSCTHILYYQKSTVIQTQGGHVFLRVALPTDISGVNNGVSLPHSPAVHCHGLLVLKLVWPMTVSPRGNLGRAHQGQYFGGAVLAVFTTDRFLSNSGVTQGTDHLSAKVWVASCSILIYFDELFCILPSWLAWEQVATCAMCKCQHFKLQSWDQATWTFSCFRVPTVIITSSR